MILQIYVENAIKHGIMHKEGQGQVSIQIRKLAKDLEIEIKDDGIGRKKAKEISTANSNGFGLKIMDNYISLFNTYNISKISSEIHDIYDDANLPMGTKVLIYIPLNFSYRLGKLEKWSWYLILNYLVLISGD